MTEVFRTASATLVDAIINHPSVRGTAEGGTYRLESAPLLAQPDNYCYANEGGCVLFVGLGAATYQGHIFCLEGSRGREALKLGHGALKCFFDRPVRVKIWAEVPMVLPAARWLVRRLGFASLGIDLEQGVERFSMETYNGRNH